VGGGFTTANGTASYYTVKWNTTSSAWEYPFGIGLSLSVFDSELDSSGNIYMTGIFTSEYKEIYSSFVSLRNDILSETPQ